MGVIARVAVSGTAGNSGDDGPATDAELSFLNVVAVTAEGGFLIADTGNSEVRKVVASRLRVRAWTSPTPGSCGACCGPTAAGA